MAGHADIWGSVMKMSENKLFLEKLTRKFSTGASSMVGGSRRKEILIYNSFISKRGWHDDETGVLAEMITQFGLRDDGRVLTYFDLIEMDEGRWNPDMWRDAWR